MPSKRLAQKEATRENIIRTAMRLYLKNGIAATADTIAKEAGLSHGAVFVHFPTRQDLQIHVLARFAQEIGDKLHNLSTDGSIGDLLAAHIDVLQDYEHFYTDLISELSVLPEEARNMVISLQSILSQHFSAAIERGQRAGVIKDIPLHILFNTWLGLLHYYLQNARLFAPGSSVLKKYKKELANNFTALIAK